MQYKHCTPSSYICRKHIVVGSHSSPYLRLALRAWSALSVSTRYIRICRLALTAEAIPSLIILPTEFPEMAVIRKAFTPSVHPSQRFRNDHARHARFCRNRRAPGGLRCDAPTLHLQACRPCSHRSLEDVISFPSPASMWALPCSAV